MKDVADNMLFMKHLSDLSITKKFTLIVGGLALTIGLLVFLSLFAINLLSSVRALIGAEGLWSKAQKDAAYHLNSYVQTRDEAHFKLYQQFLDVPLGEKIARLELLKDQTDFSIVDKGFLAGRNHPADVRGMGLVFKRFKGIDRIERARKIWGEGDALIAELQSLGETIHAEMLAGPLSSAAALSFHERIDNINFRLTSLEDKFSFILGDAARWLVNLLMWIMLGATLLFLGMGILLAYSISRQVITSVQALGDAARHIGEGNLEQRVTIKANDELGQLGKSFNLMAENLLVAQEKLSNRAKELALANQKITEHEKLKSEFFSNISHELRTPLALIKGPLDSLLSGQFGQLSKDATQMLGTMHNNVIRLLQMVQGLLDFQKLESHKVRVNREPTDIAELTEALCLDFHAMMKSRGIYGECSVQPSIGTVDLDRYLYERIVFNLLSNALKFTPKGGKIALNLSHQDDRFSLSVTDTGIGIPEHEIPLLFQKFKQVEGASTRRFEGAGLGLALVKEFSELLGGDAKVSSQLDKGSTFTVEFQAPKSTAAITQANENQREHVRLIEQYETAAAEAEISEDFDTSTLPLVLVAEDNPELANYISKLLRQICRVKLAHDGEEALEEARKLMPVMILSDVMMPRRDGLSFCKEIKADPATAHIPFILLTALTYRNALLRGWEAGANDYLFKPFHPDELKARVLAVLWAQEKIGIEQRSRHKAEVELKEREEQLLQSQKMEAIGVLAGGIAHDFNNQLTVILGACQMSLDTIDLNHALWPALNHIQEAGFKAAEVTSQLLAYSRKQILKPIVINPNETIARCERLLRYLIGENIQLTTTQNKDAGFVLADSNQLEQAITNLVVNARDAMPNGGKINIASSNRDLNAEIATAFGIPKGPYLAISVSDTGTGIDEDTKRKIFEPFFTTKPEGKGTGLGLAMVYGFVKQSGGHIQVDSTLDKGSIFTIFIPRVLEQPTKEEEAKLEHIQHSQHNETILLVEDEPGLSSLVNKFLSSCGYRVITASNGKNALNMVQNVEGKIDLIVTDVVMPEMSGKELVENLSRTHQHIKVIYMSGYSDNVISQDGVLEPGINYISKPFSLGGLAGLIAELLNA